ncbi:MAG TPA: helix-turn-helix domain-containing protein [Gemmataceae bacterium]
MSPAPFRWHSLVPDTGEPVFVLNRRRRLLFANRAWEELTGQTTAAARGLTCTRRSSDRPLAALARTLCPPPDVMRGRSARVQRPAPGSASGPPWWAVEFLPLSGEDGVIGVVGKITASGPAAAAATPPMTEAWAAVRAQAADHYRLDALDAAGQPTLAAQARLAAGSRCPVYLVGEPGAGKRWLARAIHHASDRRGLPFVALDCGHLPPAALRGVITPPVIDRGPDEIGTLYLHEPAALPREMQAELAERLADDAEPGPRVIAGSAEADDPKRPVFLGQMLPELYDALGVLVVPLPPLRARKDELPRLVDALLARAAPVFGRPVAGLTAEAWECVRAYPWPGNLRELYATLLRAGQRTTADRIGAADLSLAVQQAKAAADAPAPKPADELPPLDRVLEEVERRMIRLALERAGGNQSKAAELLGVWRPRLIRRIKALGLE